MSNIEGQARLLECLQDIQDRVANSGESEAERQELLFEILAEMLVKNILGNEFTVTSERVVTFENEDTELTYFDQEFEGILNDIAYEDGLDAYTGGVTLYFGAPDFYNNPAADGGPDHPRLAVVTLGDIVSCDIIPEDTSEFPCETQSPGKLHCASRIQSAHRIIQHTLPMHCRMPQAEHPS